MVYSFTSLENLKISKVGLFLIMLCRVTFVCLTIPHLYITWQNASEELSGWVRKTTRFFVAQDVNDESRCKARCSRCGYRVVKSWVVYL